MELVDREINRAIPVIDRAEAIEVMDAGLKLLRVLPKSQVLLQWHSSMQYSKWRYSNAIDRNLFLAGQRSDQDSIASCVVCPNSITDLTGR